MPRYSNTSRIQAVQTAWSTHQLKRVDGGLCAGARHRASCHALRRRDLIWVRCHHLHSCADNTGTNSVSWAPCTAVHSFEVCGMSTAPGCR